MKLLRFRSRPPQPSISSNAMLMTFIRCHWSACFSLGFERCPPHPPLSCVYLCGASLTVSQHRMDASFWEHCGGGNVIIHCRDGRSARISENLRHRLSSSRPSVFQPYCFCCEGRNDNESRNSSFLRTATKALGF